MDAMKRLERTARRFLLEATAVSTAAFPTMVTTDVIPARAASHGLEANASIAALDYVSDTILAVTPIGW